MWFPSRPRRSWPESAWRVSCLCAARRWLETGWLTRFILRRLAFWGAAFFLGGADAPGPAPREPQASAASGTARSFFSRNGLGYGGVSLMLVRVEVCMRPVTLLLVPAALFANQARFARVSDFDGKVETQIQAADAWMAAQRNLPLPESAWVRTGAASRLEVELDEGSAWRLGPESLSEISDYSRLSTGQRVTLLSLDHGLAYFTGEPEGKDALSLAVPGAQVILHRGERVRL